MTRKVVRIWYITWSFFWGCIFDHIFDCISVIQMIKKMEIPTTLFLSPEETDLIYAFLNSVKFQMLLVPVWTGQSWNSHRPVFPHSKIKLFSSNKSDVTLLLASKPSSAIKHLLLLLGMSLLTEKQQIFRLFFFFFYNSLEAVAMKLQPYLIVTSFPRCFYLILSFSAAKK